MPYAAPDAYEDPPRLPAVLSCEGMETLALALSATARPAVAGQLSASRALGSRDLAQRCQSAADGRTGEEGSGQRRAPGHHRPMGRQRLGGGMGSHSLRPQRREGLPCSRTPLHAACASQHWAVTRAGLSAPGSEATL